MAAIQLHPNLIGPCGGLGFFKHPVSPGLFGIPDDVFVHAPPTRGLFVDDGSVPACGGPAIARAPITGPAGMTVATAPADWNPVAISLCDQVDRLTTDFAYNDLTFSHFAAPALLTRVFTCEISSEVQGRIVETLLKIARDPSLYRDAAFDALASIFGKASPQDKEKILDFLLDWPYFTNDKYQYRAIRVLTSLHADAEYSHQKRILDNFFDHSKVATQWWKTVKIWPALADLCPRLPDDEKQNVIHWLMGAATQKRNRSWPHDIRVEAFEALSRIYRDLNPQQLKLITSGLLKFSRDKFFDCHEMHVAVRGLMRVVLHDNPQSKNVLQRLTSLAQKGYGDAEFQLAKGGIMLLARSLIPETQDELKALPTELRAEIMKIALRVSVAEIPDDETSILERLWDLSTIFSEQERAAVKTVLLAALIGMRNNPRLALKAFAILCESPWFVHDVTHGAAAMANESISGVTGILNLLKIKKSGEGTPLTPYQTTSVLMAIRLVPIILSVVQDDNQKLKLMNGVLQKIEAGLKGYQKPIIRNEALRAAGRVLLQIRQDFILSQQGSDTDNGSDTVTGGPIFSNNIITATHVRQMILRTVMSYKQSLGEWHAFVAGLAESIHEMNEAERQTALNNLQEDLKLFPHVNEATINVLRAVLYRGADLG